MYVFSYFSTKIYLVLPYFLSFLLFVEIFLLQKVCAFYRKSLLIQNVLNQTKDYDGTHFKHDASPSTTAFTQT